MIKKGILTAFVVCFMVCDLSFATPQNLTYGELLSLYFWVTTKERNIPEKKPFLQYRNLKPSNPLYQILQIAVSNGKFPNFDIDLPFERPALESDLALLMKQNFEYSLSIHSWNLLSFEFLKTALQGFYAQKQKAESPSALTEATKNAISNQIFQLLKTNFIHKEQLQHLETPNYENLTQFVNNIQDHYTKYYHPQEWKNFMDTLKNSFGGVGIYLVHQEGKAPKIIKLIEKSPAEKAGLQPQDEILAVDGIPFSHYQNFDTLVGAMKGELGTTVELQIKRWEQLLTVKLKREKIQIPIMVSQKIGKICYVRIHSFDFWIQKQFTKEILKLAPCEMFVFDVRGNPGGIVDEVVGILESFVPYKKPILTINSPEKQEVISSKNQNFFAFQKPTAILIDEATASAAEIFAGVLKHYYPETVKLIGQKSYGKGSVQEVVEFEEHSLLKYTIALWHIADQRESLDQKWLQPDLFIQDKLDTPQDEILERLGIKL